MSEKHLLILLIIVLLDNIIF